jgi:hypothetical protein
MFSPASDNLLQRCRRKLINVKFNHEPRMVEKATTRRATTEEKKFGRKYRESSGFAVVPREG